MSEWKLAGPAVGALAEIFLYLATSLNMPWWAIVLVLLGMWGIAVTIILWSEYTYRWSWPIKALLCVGAGVFVWALGSKSLSQALLPTNQPVAQVSPSIPIATPVSQLGVTMLSSIINFAGAPGGLSHFVVVYQGAPIWKISSIDVLMALAVENLQTSPTTVLAYSLETGRTKNGPWMQLCPVSLACGRSFFIPDNNWPEAIENDFASDSLESKLILHQLSPHETVSGWTLWECPSMVSFCLSAYLRFSVQNAEGETVGRIVKEIHAGSLGGGYGVRVRGGHTDLSKMKFERMPQTGCNQTNGNSN